MADVDFRVKNGLVVDNGSISLTNTTSTSIAVGTVSLNATGFFTGNTSITPIQLTLGGRLIANGGTGTAGQVLVSGDTTTNAYWATPSVVAGTNTQVQFNDSGVQGASSQLVFDKATNNLSVGNTVVTGNSSIRSTNLTLGGQITANGSTGTSGFLLTSGGASTNAYWATAPSTVAGSNTQIQYNNSGTLAGAAGLTWTNSSNSLALGASGKISFGNSTVNTTISENNLTFWSSSRLAIFSAGGIQFSAPIQANGSYGTAGYILTSGGASTNAYWSTAPSSVAGSNTQIQYNDSGSLAASTGLVFNNTTNAVSISGGLGVGTAASSTAGEIRATNNITAYYSSDARLKENVRPITNALEDLLKLRGVRFDWTDDFIQKSGGEDGYFVRKQDVGIIAQELEAVLPELVIDRQDGFKAVKYDRIVALLIEAVKELKIEVDLLKQK